MAFGKMCAHGVIATGAVLAAGWAASVVAWYTASATIYAVESLLPG